LGYHCKAGQKGTQFLFVSSHLSRLNPDFSPSFSKVAYKPCQIGFSGEEQKKQSVILPNQPKIQWGLELSGFS
jgi:hypothetical protein